MITKRKELKECILSDLQVRGYSKPPILYRVRKPLINFTIFLRKVEYLSSKKGLFWRSITRIQSIRLKRLGSRLGLTIPLNTCGPGLFIVHWGSVVISGRARIGKNCRIHSCVNIGEYKEGAPKIGDNCYIGPGAKLFGDISIGNNVVIGANAVVNSSFPDNVTIVGVPAKIIKRKGGELES